MNGQSLVLSYNPKCCRGSRAQDQQISKNDFFLHFQWLEPTTSPTREKYICIANIYITISLSSLLMHRGNTLTLWGSVTTPIFLWHTADIRSDSGCPTPCDGCGVLHYRTPHAQLGRVFQCFPFCYDSNISLIYCRRPVRLRMSDSAQWPQCFFIIGQLAPNSVECSDVFPFITFHLSFFQIYFHSYLAYLISDISQGICI